MGAMVETMSKKRIRKVFDNVYKNIDVGKAPNVSGEMRKAGYAEPTCRSLQITKTKVWKRLLSQVDETELMDVYTDCLRDPDDKRLRMQAADRITKFKGYDKPDTVSVTFTKKIQELYEDEPKEIEEPKEPKDE